MVFTDKCAPLGEVVLLLTGGAVRNHSVSSGAIILLQLRRSLTSVVIDNHIGGVRHEVCGEILQHCILKAILLSDLVFRDSVPL